MDFCWSRSPKWGCGGMGVYYLEWGNAKTMQYHLTLMKLVTSNIILQYKEGIPLILLMSFCNISIGFVVEKWMDVLYYWKTEYLPYSWFLCLIFQDDFLKKDSIKDNSLNQMFSAWEVLRLNYIQQLGRIFTSERVTAEGTKSSPSSHEANPKEQKT